MELFSEGARFYKGNLHMHTTVSDGSKTPREAARLYREHGYDFIAITDHRTVAVQTHMDDGMLILSGVELDFMLPAQALHILGVGVSRDIMRGFSRGKGPQAAIDMIRESGGLPFIGHPAWSLNTPDTLMALRNVAGVEVYNSVSVPPHNANRADSSSIIDIAAAHGAAHRLIAADDSHYYGGEACKSFVMVEAEELSERAILSALDEGRFYASQGPRFERITVEENSISVKCSPVSSIVFYSNLVWVGGRARVGENLTESVYDLSAQEGETFVRCQITDASGLSAWSSPITLS